MSRRNPETPFDRAVGERFSIAPGEVQDRDRRQYARMEASAAMRGMPKPQGRPWSAQNALWDRKAPGAPLTGQQASLGEFVQALWRASNGTGPQVVNSGGMSERVGAEGGFLVAESLRTDLMALALEQAIIRPRARVIPMREYREHVPVAEEGAHSTTIGALGGFEFGFVQEGSAPATQTPSLGNVTLTAKKMEALTLVPNELFADSDKLDSFLRVAIPAAVAWFEDSSFIGGATSGYGSGTGTGTPQGILNAPCAISVTRQTGGTCTLQDVFSMATRILPKSQNNVIWIGSPDVTAKLLSMYLAVGSPSTQAVTPGQWLTWSPGGQMQLLGRPYFSSEHVNALGSAGDLVCVDPDFYYIGDRLELMIEVAPEASQFISDQSYIRVKERIDGRVWLASAVTPTNGSQTVSPVVILH